MSRKFFHLPARYHALLESEPYGMLLETSRFDEDDQLSYLFLRPAQVFPVATLDGIPMLFEKIESACQAGFHVAGYIGYECGYHFDSFAQKLLASPAPSRLPLAWFGAFETPYVFDHSSGEFQGKAPEEFPSKTDSAKEDSYAARNCRLTISEDEYRAKVEAIKEYIRAGDTYQVNFTGKMEFDFSGSAAALFSELRARQRVSYSSFLNLNGKYILSFSPELFFRLRDGEIVTRPMKGTVRRGKNIAEDAQLAQWLHGDAKNRSENVMIVDLLRNDLGRISRTGSVRVDEMFKVEKYETLFQMTSRVSGELRPGLRFYDVFQSLFPSGSVTGAPKIRTAEIISELEQHPRGVYTGAIGFFAPRQRAVFNVAIRTVALDGNRGEMGVGSGIVYDSVPEQEYAECRLKADFLARPRERFQLLESLLWSGGYASLAEHLERLRASAEYFGFEFEAVKIRGKLERAAAYLQPGTEHKVRVLLDEDGDAAVEASPLGESLCRGRVMISPVRTSSEDRFLFHKTTRRQLYDEAYLQAQRCECDDMVFLNEREEVTEGAIHNLFIEVEGKLLTPPVSCGLLPGIFRRRILESRADVEERILRLEDLKRASAIYICNAIRGMRKVALAE